MTTYTVTMANKSINYSFTWNNQTAKQVKEIKATYKNTKGAKVTAVEEIKCYYRGNEVHIIEERQLGWTLVWSTETSKPQFLAVTAELEYR
jgi:hypothetical protein